MEEDALRELHHFDYVPNQISNPFATNRDTSYPAYTQTYRSVNCCVFSAFRPVNFDFPDFSSQIRSNLVIGGNEFAKIFQAKVKRNCVLWGNWEQVYVPSVDFRAWSYGRFDLERREEKAGAKSSP